MIIALSGKKSSGKDTVAKIIQYLMMVRQLGDRGLRLFADGPQSSTDPLFHFNIFSKWDEGKRSSYSSWHKKMFAYKLKQIVCLLIGCTMEQLEDAEFKEKELGEDWNRLLYADIKDTNPLVAKTTPRWLLQTIGTEYGRNIIHPNMWINALMSEYKSFLGGAKRDDIVRYGSGYIDLVEYSKLKEEGKDYEHIIFTEKTEDLFHTVYPNWIITDLRFPNEPKAIEDKDGIIIRISRPTHYYMCDECDAEDIQQYELVKEDTCPRCNFEGEGNLTLVIPGGDTHPSETALDNYPFKYTIDNNCSIEHLMVVVKDLLTELKII